MSFNPTRARRSAFAVAAAGLLLTTAACGSSNDASGSSGDANAKVTMTLWTNSTTGPGVQFFKDAATAFHTQHPNVTIKVQSVQNEDYDGKLQTALQAGKGSAPDIMFQRGGGKMLAMVQAGQLGELTLSGDASSNISTGAQSIFQADGKTYGVPLSITPEGIWYSTDLFKKAGLTGTPTTIADLTSDAAKLQAAGTPLAVGGKDGWPAAHWYYMFAVRDCSQDALNKAASSAQFADPCFLQAGKDLGTFVATKPFEKDAFNTAAQGSAASTAGLLANHKVAGELMGAWEPGVVGDLTPDKKPLADLGYFPFPSTVDGKGDATAMMEGADGYSCSAWAPQQCNEFLNFLATADQESKYATAFSAIPANKAAQGSVTDAASKAALEAANNAKYSVLFLDTLFGSNIGNALNTAVVNFMSGQSSDPQSIVDAVNNASTKG
ncbi:ABC transporter substrate-binding protein [Nocardioides sp. BP30]|uniref:ABC transporter substrate-binding protein n=1 Tax=Nocardioides sp. BP30 TaxID=3036374 RepID=UPI002468F6CD|nr:ABC transporter substrate-binding protein [Nocardioides sp. BP30]WGL50906.1 ABC transporter substrate-binding protein [Nocardioides sp. BP30]